MTWLRQWTASAVIVLILVVTFGCGKPGPKVVTVSGTVMYDGQPLAEGTIYFKTPATGAIDTLPVKDGKFEGNAEVGERRVEINAYRTKSQDFNGMKGEVKENLIPARYNADSKLTATVTAEGPNTFQFEVKSK